jgi:ABC-type transport system involved in cytochrome bd biosynthesis fused ATPase/permease subunit
VPFALALEAARRRWRAMHARAMGSDDALHEEIDDLVRHTDLWRAFGSGHHVANVVRERGSEAARARARAEAARTALSASNEVLAALALALAVMLASRLPGSAGGATLVAFAAIFFMAYRPLRDLGDARSWVSRGERALRELGEVAACVTETRRRPQLRAVAGQAGDTTLEVRDLAVGERCPPVSFRLRPGECVVVLGRTGAGKTTLARALLGLEPEARGSVRLGGRRLEPGEVGPEARRMAWVPQEAPVVSGTLEQNVGLIGGTARGARAELALLGASDLGDRIAHVKLGAAGRGLSGGERRWISLARALSTGLPVLVLDEPTSGLDEASRRRVLQVLAAMRGRRSLVVVTHDADVLALADQVLQIGGGQDARPAPALGPRPDHRGLRGPRPSATSRS